MSFLRFLMLLALVIWLGALLSFPVVAQTSFSVLPSRSLAGQVVGHSLIVLHWMGIVSATTFLICSLTYSRFSTGVFHPFALRNVLVVLMLALTLISQFTIIPRMDALRASIPGEMDSVARDFPARAQFDALHVWSTRVEEGVMLLGLLALLVLARSWRERA